MNRSASRSPFSCFSTAPWTWLRCRNKSTLHFTVNVPILHREGSAEYSNFDSHQNSKYPPAGARREPPSVPVAGNRPTIPRKFSQAARFSAGSEPTRSRIMFHAAMLRAPSGGGPIARETEHCGQKQIRWAADFWRGLIPTVCANIYTATDLCPASNSRPQRRQHKFSKGPPGGQLRPRGNTVATPWLFASV